VKHSGKALITVAALAFLLGGPASSEQGACFLSIENGRLCMTVGRDTKCLQIRQRDRYEDLDRFQCLIRLRKGVERCLGVTIAQNTFVRFDPFSLKYEAIFFRHPSKQFYTEDQINDSCRVR
jgi:hypothetical protein